MPKDKSVWLLAAVLLIAVFFRFWDLTNIPPGLWADEAMNGNNAVEPGWKVFYPENFGREGLFINIQSLFIAAFGHHPWALRLPSAIFGVLTALGLYLMTKGLFGKRIAFFAAFFLATSFWHIMFSRIGFRAIMAPFFLVWAFYFLFRGMRFPSTFYFLFSGLLFGLGFHTYIAYRIAPLIALLPLWRFYKSWQEDVGRPLGRPTSKYCAPCLIGLFIFAAFIAALPLLWYYAQNPQDFLGRTAGISIFSTPEPLAQFSENLAKTLGMFNVAGDFNWRHNLAGSPQLWWPIGILFLIGLGIGIWDLFRNWKLEIRNSGANYFAYKFTILWFIIMLLPVAVSNEGLPHALRSLILIPPTMIFAALGLEFVISKFEKKEPPTPLTLALLFLFFLAATTHTYNTYFLRWAPNFNVYQAFQSDLTEKANWLNRQPKDLKKYVVTDEVSKIDLRGSPMSLQPIIFITDTFFEARQKEKNIYYVTAADTNRICGEEKTPLPHPLPLRKGEGQGEGVISSSPNCIIVPIEDNTPLLRSLKQKIPGLRLDASPGFVILRI